MPYGRKMVLRFVLAAVAITGVLGVVACEDDDDAGTGTPAGTTAKASCDESQPEGSYKLSCSPCSMTGTILQCQCDTGNGYKQSTKIDTCSCPSRESTQSISNNAGSLYCGTAKPAAGTSSSGSGSTGSTSGSG